MTGSTLTKGTCGERIGEHTTTNRFQKKCQSDVPPLGGGGGCGGGGGGGGGSTGVAPAMVWAGAWLGPTLPTLVPPFGRGGRKRAQVFRRRKSVVFGCWAAWVTDVAPVSVHAREVLTPSAVARCRSVTLPNGCPKPLCVCRVCSVRANTSCLRVPCGCSKRYL